MGIGRYLAGMAILGTVLFSGLEKKADAALIHDTPGAIIVLNENFNHPECLQGWTNLNPDIALPPVQDGLLRIDGYATIEKKRFALPETYELRANIIRQPGFNWIGFMESFNEKDILNTFNSLVAGEYDDELTSPKVICANSSEDSRIFDYDVPAGKFHEVSMVRTKDRMEFYLNEKLVNFLPTNTSQNKGHLQLQVYAGSHSPVFIEGMEVWTIPEPSSAGLLGIGLTAAALAARINKNHNFTNQR